ncbi:hypothetical protein A2X44_02805 [candidate division CPR3 bacterium GWF2_35_18]|uniref:ComE operon protein 1 n=1 Tax=candidate division CPR3 bacterium GW2011_GWF2_35_18 TaxID=1618350 RepID=A0A0G0EQ30_UNCC3|nr:MAG: ComE operon protein 1 [candidate division CPR3 bacterium GW2011_GWF2_35_18]OGB62915.1 MAG: hypothetical protein A2X44_02805 [candidate division CPR3 bacterium GWF2_35_18]OGB65959.1 MAG: hypothetical protein A2250_03585 [candidate division CPR3 bacterium RIFOXYA2_FULL_35_13]OGB75718.1 MAG: hypothetical protein A2476_05230 [candidate division CPR3 bacterium RIFOXYC2_FULL_35_7]OGB79183.1 MAG: hypothetical protein A2296_00980 [candidate division CPR3 bacterium RIFOXYB2_FULL_35_8]
MYHQILKLKFAILLLFLIIFVSVVVFYLFSHRKQSIDNQEIVLSESVDYQYNEETDKKILIVDISGQILNPGVYEMSEGDRVIDLITRSGGITIEADKSYIEKHLNQAAQLIDGQKIYIPKEGENLLQNDNSSFGNQNSQGKVSINYGSATDLDSLPGIGEKRASSIIKNRPYASIEELLLRKIIPQSVFEDIKNDISL